MLLKTLATLKTSPMHLLDSRNICINRPRETIADFLSALRFAAREPQARGRELSLRYFRGHKWPLFHHHHKSNRGAFSCAPSTKDFF
jgi:hypothetical protein